MTVNASSLTRISVDTGGTSANSTATFGTMSANGRYVAFHSAATNLVGGDVNGAFDIFLRDTVTGTTTLISAATDDTQGNNLSTLAAITNDGRYVFFNSYANNLVGGDTNSALDVFMRDTVTGVTTRVSTASDGSQADESSQNVDVTGNGAFIVFMSFATNLVAGDTNGFIDVFVKNLTTGAVTRVSVADDDVTQGNGHSVVGRLSDDGNRVSFASTASNLTANDTNGAVNDIFVRDIAAGTTTLVSVATGGGSGDGQSFGASISGNGRYAAFESDATNLVASDTNGATDIFVRDLQTNTTTRVSTATDGSQSNDLSGQAVISAEGRYVVFSSLASNLVQGDTNGLRDIFLKDVVTGNVTRLSVAMDGTELNGVSDTPSISADGHYVAFQTQATDTGVGAEGNGTGFDVFRISLVAGAGADRMIGSDGNDTIDGLAGDDVLLGGFGNDLLTGGAGADQIAGGAGTDAASYATSATAVMVTVNGAASGGDAAGDTMTGIENVVGSAFNDTLTGDAGANTLTGGDGNDTLIGLGGADTVQGGNGTDTVTYAASAAAVVATINGTGSGGDAQGDALSGIENLIGSAFADTLTGDAGTNVLNGGDGNDTLQGGAGADALQGGNGNDTISYAASAAGVALSLSSGTTSGGDAAGDTFSSIENVIGSAFADTINGSAGANVLNGGAGDDLLAGRGGADTLIGGAGSDTAYYIASSAVTINLATNTSTGGDATGDTFTSIENLSGSNFADTLTGDAGANMLDGGAGNDALQGGAGADTLNGGAGIDTASYAASTAGVTVNLLAGTGTGGDAQGDTLAAIENLIGSALDDTLIGSDAANVLTGGNGDDTLQGGAGADTLDGGTGIDRAIYAASAAAVVVNLATGTGTGGDAQGDTLTGIENLTGSSFADRLYGSAAANTLSGGAGDDQLRGGAGADILDGGNGSDFANYQGSTAAVTVDLLNHTASGGDAQGDVLTGIENLYGSSNADHLSGDNARNVIGGELGNDTIVGNGGDDSLSGEGGDDTIDGGDGADRLVGGDGLDTIHGGTGNDSVDAGVGNDQVFGEAGHDNVYGGAGDDTIDGGDGNDIIEGDGGADTIIGGAGIDTAVYAGSAAAVSVNLATGAMSGGDAAGDTLSGIEQVQGSAFADTLTGDANPNTLWGLGGNDVLTGGGGGDALKGGAGSDRFVYTALSDSAVSGIGKDGITDFATGDRIDLSAIDADGNPSNGDTVFTFGTGAFTGAAGELRVVTAGSIQVVYVDGDGDKAPDFAINVISDHALTAGDFVL